MERCLPTQASREEQGEPSVPSRVAFPVAPRHWGLSARTRIGFEPPASPFFGMSVGTLGDSNGTPNLGTLTPQQSCWALTGCRQSRSQAPRACPCRHKIAENAGWDCELLAIELPDLAKSPGARRPRHSDHRDGKALCLRRRKRWLITVWLEVRVQCFPVSEE